MAQVWEKVDVPGPEVLVLCDELGVVWTRDDPTADIWWGNVGHDFDVHRDFHALLKRGPLTDATGEV
jgi:hypothetical protein